MGEKGFVRGQAGGRGIGIGEEGRKVTKKPSQRKGGVAQGRRGNKPSC